MDTALIKVIDVHTGEQQFVSYPVSVWDKIARLGSEIDHNEVYVSESQTIAKLIRTYPAVEL